MREYVCDPVRLLLPLILLLFPISAVGSDVWPVVEGVFGLDQVEEEAAVAFWTPLDPGEALTGFWWFNNDGDVTFPQVKALAADCGRPELLSLATSVGGAVQGGDGAWSRYTFEIPLTSVDAGLYVILNLPADGACTHTGQGGGAGVGYTAGDGRRQCWITVGDDPWEALTGDYRMAVMCETTADKSMRCLRIGRTAATSATDVVEPVQDMPDRGQVMRAYPNPFNPQTEIVFNLGQAAPLTAAVFDLRGWLVRTLCSEWRDAGEHRWTWDGRDNGGRPSPSGAYLVKISAGEAAHTVLVTLIQ